MCMSVFHTSCPVHLHFLQKALPPPVTLSPAGGVSEAAAGGAGGGAGAGAGEGDGALWGGAAADGVHTQGGAGGAGEAAFTADQCTGAGTRRPAKGGERRHCTRY